MTGLVVLQVAWMSVGGLAAFQRGDFADGNCSTVTDTAWVVLMGPLNHTAPETLLRTCVQHTEATRSGTSDYQPSVPGAPLKGPVTLLVIQPP